MPAVDAPPIKANDLAIAIKWYNSLAGSGLKPDSALFTTSLIAHIVHDIATLEHKLQSNPVVIARARVAAAKIIAAKAGSDYPGGGITNAIGGTIAEAGGNPIVQGVKDVVTAPITVAEFLAKLANPFLWVRVAEVAGGAILLVIGVRMLARESGVDIPIPKPPMLRKG